MIKKKEDKSHIVKLSVRKPAPQMEEFSMIETLLKEQTKIMQQEKKLSLTDAIIAQIKGDRGDKGEKGELGKQGDIGFSGEKGERGAEGNRGIPGIRGKEGPSGREGIQGDTGSQGEEGELGPIPNHQYDNGRIRFQKPDGEWGQWINLRELMEDTDKKFGNSGKILHRGHGENFQDDETPSGDVDGSNKVFTIASAPLTGSLKVYVGGSRQRITEDYTLSGNTITFILAPETNSIILCDYRI